METDTAHLWANGFGVWHAAVTPGADAAQRAQRAIRAELIEREDVKPGSGYRVRVELAPAWAQDRTDGRVVYREAVPA